MTSYPFTSFTITQPFLGAPLHFTPALGSDEFELLIDCYVTGSASKRDKLSQVTINFYNTATVDLNTGALTKTYHVFPALAFEQSPTQSQSSGFSPPMYTPSPSSSATHASSFGTTPATRTATASGRIAKKAKKEVKKPAEARLPGFSIMTKDGIDVTSSAGRGTKTKEQREHAHLMRQLKACSDCKRKKIRCDPSHRRSHNDMSRTSTSNTSSSSSGQNSSPDASTPSTSTSQSQSGSSFFDYASAWDDFIVFPPRDDEALAWDNADLGFDWSLPADQLFDWNLPVDGDILAPDLPSQVPPHPESNWFGVGNYQSQTSQQPQQSADFYNWPALSSPSWSNQMLSEQQQVLGDLNQKPIQPSQSSPDSSLSEQRQVLVDMNNHPVLRDQTLSDATTQASDVYHSSSSQPLPSQQALPDGNSEGSGGSNRTASSSSLTIPLATSQVQNRQPPLADTQTATARSQRSSSVKEVHIRRRAQVLRRLSIATDGLRNSEAAPKSSISYLASSAYSQIQFPSSEIYSQLQLSYPSDVSSPSCPKILSKSSHLSTSTTGALISATKTSEHSSLASCGRVATTALVSTSTTTASPVLTKTVLSALSQQDQAESTTDNVKSKIQDSLCSATCSAFIQMVESLTSLLSSFASLSLGRESGHIGKGVFVKKMDGAKGMMGLGKMLGGIWV